MQLATMGASQTMSSLEISELTGKEHKEILRDIRKMLAEAEIDAAQFCAPQKYGNNNTRDVYNLPRRECDLVISGYSVKYRLAIIDRWQELEKPKQKTALELAREQVILLETIESQTILIEQQAHKLDESSKWATVKRMEAQHKLKFNWRELKTYSERNGYETPKIADVNYPAGVNTYHEDVWMEVYQVEILPQKGTL